jgi:LysM repeat protein
MAGVVRTHPGPSGVDPDGRRGLGWLVLLGIMLFFAVTVAMVISTLSDEHDTAGATTDRAAIERKLPVYWKVHSGDTYASIAAKTGLSVDDLETFNPYVDPSTIQPGQRLKLRAKVPPPKPKPKGPKYATVRTGDSFGSIAAKTGKSIVRLQQLNPKLKPTTLQPGDRVRLR